MNWNKNTDSCGPGSSVGIATDFGVDGPGFSSRPDRPWAPPSLLYNGYRLFPGGRGGRGVGLTNPPRSSAEGPRKEYSYNATHPKGLRGLQKGWKPTYTDSRDSWWNWEEKFRK